LIARKLDVGFESALGRHPVVTFEPLMELLSSASWPLDHPLTAKSQVEPRDLIRSLSWPLVRIRLWSPVETMFEAIGSGPKSFLATNVAQSLMRICGRWARRIMVHPLAASGLEHHSRGGDSSPESFFIYRSAVAADGRNAQLVEAFAQVKGHSRARFPLDARRVLRSAASKTR